MTEERESEERVEDLEVTEEEAADVKGGDGVVSPRDPATGQATGRRQHANIGLVKEWDANSP